MIAIKRFLIVVTLLAIGSLASVCSQPKTCLYKRVMIVDGNQRKTCNDDAHYITFTRNGFYESDKSGNGISGCRVVEFMKNENGYHCYAGVTAGVYSIFYFARDYSRINVKTGNEIWVYQKETGLTTSAAKRRHDAPASSGTAPNVPVYSVPVSPSSGGSGGNQNTNRTCPLCKGTGKHGDEVVYQPDYTGRQPSVYCQVCGRTTSPHTHRHKMCTVCCGRGYIR